MGNKEFSWDGAANTCLKTKELAILACKKIKKLVKKGAN